MGSPVFKNFFSARLLDTGRAEYDAPARSSSARPTSGVRARLSNLQSGLRHDAQRTRSVEDVRRQQRSAAVAVALRMVPVADGSDNGGSLRNPAAWNNVFGFRTSTGRVPSQFYEVFHTVDVRYMGRWLARCRTLRCFFGDCRIRDSRTPLSIARGSGPALRRTTRSATSTGRAHRMGRRFRRTDTLRLRRCSKLAEGSLKVFEALGW